MALDTPPMTLEETQNLYKGEYHASAQEQDAQSAVDALHASGGSGPTARGQAILDAGLGVGVKAGLTWQLGNIKKALSKREREFDTVYDFSHLMIKDRVVPPVISEARDLYTQAGDDTLRLSGAFYKIEYQARFSSVPPNWREYLVFAVPKLDRSGLVNALMPKTKAEKRIWELAVRDGWRQGVDQANLMLEHAFNRLNRDRRGMLMFHQFVRQGKITMPVIAVSSIPVTQEGGTLAVDETLLRITKLPEFNGNRAQWRASVSTSPYGSPKIVVPVPLADQSWREEGRAPAVEVKSAIGGGTNDEL